MLVVEKPGTPEEVLAHFGKKGMKWGVRQKFNAANPTSREKADTIRLARATSNVKFEKATRMGGTKADRAKAKKAYLKDPNRAIALRTTRGEKVVFGLVAASGIGTVPIAVVMSGRVIARKHIEKKQARGGYN